MKYNFKIQKGNMIFGVDNCDSFDEAVKKCRKGVEDYERENGPINITRGLYTLPLNELGNNSTYQPHVEPQSTVTCNTKAPVTNTVPDTDNKSGNAKQGSETTNKDIDK